MADDLAERRETKVTPETFTLEHMHKLVRGMGVAEEKMEDLTQDNKRLDDKNVELKAKLVEMQFEIEGMRRDEDQWDAMLEMIDDVRRGVRELNELYALVGNYARVDA